MSEEIIPYSKEELAKFEENLKPLIDGFIKDKLSTTPNPKIIKTNNGVSYIPIEVIEAILDKIFMGFWNVENLKYSIEINSVVVTLEIRFLHPITKTWLTRAGIGSVPVQMNKKTGQINPMALQKNLPAAKAFAFKNAAQSVGRALGRNINRGWDIPHKEDTSNFKSIFDEKD